MVQTLVEPTSEERLLNLYNAEQRMRLAAGAIPLEADATYTLCLLKLAPAVQQADYPALKTAIESVVGVQEIRLVTDHHTRESLPDGRALTANVVLAIRMPVVEE